MAARTATANLASARAQFDNAASTETRQAALLEKKTTSQAAFDNAEQERAAAQANMEQAEANLAKAREQLSYAVLTADYSGVVTATYAEVGQTVSPGQANLAIAEPARRDAVIDAPEQVIDALRVGQNFDVALQIDPTRKVDRDGARDRAGIGRRDPDPAGEDRAGQSARNPSASAPTIFARLATGANATIRIPDSSVLRDGDRTQVFVVDPVSSKVALRDVEVASDRRPGRWIVRAGLKGGERIVTAGVHRLKAGEEVKIYGSEAR